MSRWSYSSNLPMAKRWLAVTGVVVLAAISAVVVLNIDDSPGLGTALVQESVTDSGYTGRVVITNSEPDPVSGWTMELELPEGSEIVKFWGADMTTSGSRYVFTSQGHNELIESGSMVSFGFTVLGTGTPTYCSVNGRDCVPPADDASPDTPANLRVMGVTVSSVSLAWDAAVDNFAVVSYRIYGDADGAASDGGPTLLASTSSTDTVVTGLTPGAAYSFSVSSVDIAGNESAVGDAVAIRTAAGDDTAKPTPPSDLRVKSNTATAVELAWTASDDNDTVEEYRVYEGANVVVASSSLSVQITGLDPYSTHTYEVTAVDAAENESPRSDAVTVTTAASDGVDPSPSAEPSVTPEPSPTASPSPSPEPAGVLLTRGRPTTASSEGELPDGTKAFGPERAVDGSQETRWASKSRISPSWLRVDLGGTARLSRIKLQWDLSCATEYSIETSLDGVVWRSIYSTTEGDGDLDDIAVGGVGRFVQVVGHERCRDQRGYSLREFEAYGSLDQTSGDPDRADATAPAPPTELTASDITATSASFSWVAATDDVGVVGYDVYHDGNLLRSVQAPATTVTLTGLAGNTRYRVTVLARDAAGNVSQASNMVPVTTADGGDSNPPNSKQTLRSTSVTAASVSLEWDAASDDATVIYDVYIGGAKIGTVEGTCVVVTGLAARTSYEFHIKARDTAGNNSPASNTVSITTRSNDTEVPPDGPSVRPEPDGTTPSGGGGGGTRIGEVKTIADDLDVPWGVTFLPNGDALVAERDTFTIYRIATQGDKKSVGKVDGAATTGGEGGLLGLAISPSFSSDHLLYAYHSTKSDNRVVRMRFENDQLGDPDPILTGIPRNRFHNGGRIIFGPDKLLYIATGDAQNSGNAQNRSSLGGKILRVTADGKPAPGNPFAGSPVLTYGHRNVQGLWFDSRGRLWASEFGNSERDEVNLISAGKNYGWPECEGRCGRGGFVDPAHEWPVAQASPSGLCIVGDTIFMASLRGTRLWRMEIDGSDVSNVKAFFVGTYGRLRTVIPAPDGSIWMTTSNQDDNGRPRSGDDRILRVELE